MKTMDETELAEVRRQRDAYYDELLKLRQQKAEWMDKACGFLRKEYEQANRLIRAVCDRNVGDLIDIDASVKLFIKTMKK